MDFLRNCGRFNRDCIRPRNSGDSRFPGRCLPAIILILAPYALLVGLTILLVRIQSPRRQSLNKTAIGWVLAGCVLVLAVAAAWFNHRLEQEVQALTKEDRDLSEPLTGTRDIAIQFVTVERARLKSELARQQEFANSGVVPPPTRKQFCERLCLHLLFDGQADSVFVSSVSVYAGGPAPSDLADIGTRFHLGRAGCRNPAIKQKTLLRHPTACSTVARRKALQSRCRPA